jgi:hypothetical protein
MTISGSNHSHAWCCDRCHKTGAGYGSESAAHRAELRHAERSRCETKAAA